MLISDWFTTGDYDRYPDRVPRHFDKEKWKKAYLYARGLSSRSIHACKCYRLVVLPATYRSQSTAVSHAHNFLLFPPEE